MESTIYTKKELIHRIKEITECNYSLACENRDLRKENKLEISKLIDDNKEDSKNLNDQIDKQLKVIYKLQEQVKGLCLLIDTETL